MLPIDKYMTAELILPNEARFNPHLDRDPVWNVWDNSAGTFSAVKSNIESGETSIDEALSMADRLFISEDPALVKTGIHIYRFSMWKDSSVAYRWMDKASKLFKHEHPRIRHSTIWNLRTAAWQDPELARVGLDFAERGLNDRDTGVRRASMWAHGDFVVNDPNLFDPAYDSLDEFLAANSKESNNLFALERFFRSLQQTHGDDPRFRDSVARIRRKSDGYPGLRVRAATMLGENVTNKEVAVDEKILKEGYERVIGNISISSLSPDDAFYISASRFSTSQTFKEGVFNLALMKNLVWLSDDLKRPFEILSHSLVDKRDGDLTRSATVIMADCAIRNPKMLDHAAAVAVKDFFEKSDIDGSQIVTLLVLDPILQQDPEHLSESVRIIPELKKLAANRSVTFALGDY